MTINWEKLRNDRRERINQSMKEHNVDAIVVNRSDLTRYVTDYHSSFTVAFAHAYLGIQIRDGPIGMSVPNQDIPDIQREYPWIDEAIGNRPGGHAAATAKFLENHSLSAGRIALDSYMFWPTVEELRRKLPAAEFINGYEVIDDARIIKTPEEIKVYDEGCSLAEIGMKAGLEAIWNGEGMTEQQIAAEAECAMLRAGTTGDSWLIWDSEVIAGPNLAFQKRVFSNRRVRYGELVLLDQGCIYQGYNVEFTRMDLVGGPRVVTKESKDLYTAIYNCHWAEIKAMRPRATSLEIHQAAVNTAIEQGFGDVIWPSSAHGIGTSCYEKPSVGTRKYCGEPIELKPGMLLAIEPALFKPGKFYLRLEDHVLVTESGYRVLTRSPYADHLLN